LTEKTVREIMSAPAFSGALIAQEKTHFRSGTESVITVNIDNFTQEA